jgi:formylglycine-generating enzyme required for sulfatase activity
LEDVGEGGLGRTAAAEIQSALMEALANRSLPPAVQRDAGFSLARTGWAPNDLDAWVDISAGEFLYGDEKQKAKIETPFAIQKYPVTNLQFRKFIEDGGYDKQEFWSADGWAWRTGTYNTKATEDYQKEQLERRPVEKRHEPYFWHDEKWNNPLAPVVGVTWFEAEAYGNWLAKQLGRPVRLPTEQEWERAARGIKGREYAWGDEFDRNKVNCAAFWEQKDDASFVFGEKGEGTSIVGQFKEGNTIEGISDLSGNVWEWTNSWWEKEQTNRVVRGGSWSLDRRDVRCANRFRLVPVDFNLSIGFRLVSPGS